MSSRSMLALQQYEQASFGQAMPVNRNREIYQIGRWSVIEDDTVGDNVTYMLASGSVGRGDGRPVSEIPVEAGRNILQGTGVDELVVRRSFLLHPYGISWTGNASSTTASDAELRTAGNWTRVANQKHVGIVRIEHASI
jgi:hypothetical protein